MACARPVETLKVRRTWFPYSSGESSGLERLAMNQGMSRSIAHEPAAAVRNAHALDRPAHQLKPLLWPNLPSDSSCWPTDPAVGTCPGRLIRWNSAVVVVGRSRFSPLMAAKINDGAHACSKRNGALTGGLSVPRKIWHLVTLRFASEPRRIGTLELQLAAEQDLVEVSATVFDGVFAPIQGQAGIVARDNIVDTEVDLLIEHRTGSRGEAGRKGFLVAVVPLKAGIRLEVARHLAEAIFIAGVVRNLHEAGVAFLSGGEGVRLMVVLVVVIGGLDRDHAAITQPGFVHQFEASRTCPARRFNAGDNAVVHRMVLI